MDSAASTGSSGPADDRARLDLVGALEDLKNAATGLQAALAVAVDDSVREQAAVRGVPVAGVATGWRTRSRWPGGSRPIVANSTGSGQGAATELPHTWAALRAGRVSEWRATIVARETGCLSRADRREVDRRVARDAEALAAMGDRELGDAVRRHRLRRWTRRPG